MYGWMGTDPLVSRNNVFSGKQQRVVFGEAVAQTGGRRGKSIPIKNP